MVQPELLGLLGYVKAPSLAVTGCSHRRLVDAKTGRFEDRYMPQDFTSWEAIYTSLRAAFPTEAYHTDEAVAFTNQSETQVRLQVGDKETLVAMLVGADGFRSSLRQSFAPETTSRYAGYVAWRGVLDEADAPESLVDFFDDKFTFCNANDGGHALCYFIPGDNLSVTRGRRRLNWVWYRMVDEGPAFDAIMTDRAGQHRDASVPEGEVRDEVLADMRDQAFNLAAPFAEVVRVTPRPFIQAIYDIAPPRMVFGRVCLLGDAAFVVRPHTAAAAAKAAADAASLARALRSSAPDMSRGLELWEQQQLVAGRELVKYGVMLGEQSNRTGAR